ncbi:MAG: NUDIX hydrolase [Patescibacteria group bacterium]|jgi:ADP-ribose pyrophosphatase YjhB (NUDIX family)
MLPYRFCPKCGGRLKTAKPSAPECRQCGFIFFQNSALAFGALIIDARGRILLARRKFAPQKGKWDLLGGFLLYGEEAEDAVARELKEELGIKVKESRLIGTEVGDYLFQGIKFKTMNLFYLVSDWRGEIRPQDDVASVTWFNRKDLPRTGWAFGWITKAIKKWQRGEL